MPRRAKVIERQIQPDPKYNSALMAKFINKVMLRGQKATAERIIYQALELAGERLKQAPVSVLEQAIKKVTPLLQVKPRRVGGATYQVPVEVPPDRGISLAMKWLIRSTRTRSGKSMVDKLTSEIIDAAQGQGASVKKREEMHKMAEANKAFAHYRW